MKNRSNRVGAPSLAALASGLLLCSLAFLAGTASSGELLPYREADTAPPAFVLKTPEGQTRRLEDYRGKAVLVNFWATWCPPCLAELPSLERLADRLAGEGFEVLIVNVGESPFRVAKFLKLTGVRLESLLDKEGAVFKAWGGNVYPTSFVLDAKGVVRYVAIGPLAWADEDVVKTLSGLLPSR